MSSGKVMYYHDVEKQDFRVGYRQRTNERSCIQREELVFCLNLARGGECHEVGYPPAATPTQFSVITARETHAERGW